MHQTTRLLAVLVLAIASYLGGRSRTPEGNASEGHVRIIKSIKERGKDVISSRRGSTKNYILHGYVQMTLGLKTYVNMSRALF
jgi:hypothetical protein